MKKVKIVCNWDNDVNIMNRVISNYQIGDSNDDFIFTSKNDYDYLICLNKTNHTPLVPKEKVFTFIMEPSWSPNWDRNCFNYSGKVFCHDKKLFGGHPSIEESTSFMFYHMDYKKTTLKQILIEKNEHKKRISMVVSFTPNGGYNYSKRTQLALSILDNDLPVDIYGNGWDFINHPNVKGSIGDKLEGVKDYSFSIAIENSCEKNYLTEKFFDVTLCGGVPIYYGCPNVSDIYGNYIPIDLDNIPETIQTIKDVIYTNKYDHMLNDKTDITKYAENHNLIKKIKELINYEKTI